MFTINTSINNSANSNHRDVLQSRSSHHRHRKINSSGKHHNHNVVLQSSYQSSHSRREALKKAFYLAPVIEVAIQPVETANALPQCNPKLHNCIDVIWKPPSSLTKPSEVATAIREVLNSYPQDGQAGVDCNGWMIVQDNLDDDAGIISLEFKSCVGPAAIGFNLGQPFIDDVKLELNKNADGGVVVAVKSQSRMGSSDLYVNRKRLEYLGDKLYEQGWTIPYPMYANEKAGRL